MRISLPLLLLFLMLGFFASVHLESNTKAVSASNSEEHGETSLGWGSIRDTIQRSQTATKSSTLEKVRTIPVTVGTKVDFDSQIRPIFEARCQPCHFNGGKMYAQLPFDRQETIKRLGTKLFTRIKDENERRLIREFLEQQ